MAEMNAMPLINGVSYAWADITLTIAGTPVMGITAIEYEDKQTIQNRYGAGRLPIARSKGKIESTAKITLSMDEVVALQRQAPNGRLQDLPLFDVGVTYTPETGANVHDTIRNCQFASMKRSWSSDGDGNVEFDLLPSHIEWSVK